METETQFSASIGTLDKQFEGASDQLEEVVKGAKKRGYTPHYNDVYMPQIADDVGDPAAFCKPNEVKHHVKKVCEERGWEARGAVKVDRVQRPEPQP